MLPLLTNLQAWYALHKGDVRALMKLRECEFMHVLRVNLPLTDIAFTGFPA